MLEGLEVVLREDSLGINLSGLGVGIGHIHGQESLFLCGDRIYYIPYNQIVSINRIGKGIMINTDAANLEITNGGDPRLLSLRHYLIPRIYS